jgi:hypothetical protein
MLRTADISNSEERMLIKDLAGVDLLLAFV